MRVGRKYKVTNSSRRAAGSPVEISMEDKRFLLWKAPGFAYEKRHNIMFRIDRKCSRIVNLSTENVLLVERRNKQWK